MARAAWRALPPGSRMGRYVVSGCRGGSSLMGSYGRLGRVLRCVFIDVLGAAARGWAAGSCVAVGIYRCARGGGRGLEGGRAGRRAVLGRVTAWGGRVPWAPLLLARV